TCTQDGFFGGVCMPAMLARMESGGDPKLEQPVTFVERLANPLGLFMASKSAQIARANEFFTRCAPMWDVSRAERRKVASPELWVKNDLGPRYMLLGLLTPALSKAAGSDEITRSQIEGTRLMLRVELYQRRNGHYPR